MKWVMMVEKVKTHRLANMKVNRREHNSFIQFKVLFNDILDRERKGILE